VQFEEALRRRLELQRADVAGDGHYQRVRKRFAEAVEPARVHHAVVVGERDDLAADDRERGIARSGLSR
jgi:hypothetical protein